MTRSCTRIKRYLVFLILICTFTLIQLQAEDSIVYGVNQLPPWKMVTDGRLEGPEIELIQEIFRRFSYEITFRECLLTRCLKNMQDGDIDVMTGLIHTEEREKYVHFIEPPYKTKSNKAFFVLKGNSSLVANYEDLHKLKVGIGFGASYFPRFDSDPNIFKVKKYQAIDLFRLLINGGIDTFIITDSQGDYLIKENGFEKQIEKARYGYYADNNVYICISKKSKLMQKIEDLSALVAEIKENGTLDQIFQNYFRRNNLPVPVYK